MNNFKVYTRKPASISQSPLLFTDIDKRLEVVMIAKKIFPLIISAMLLIFVSSPAQAEFFSISVGIPVTHTLSDSDLEADGVSGYMAHFKLPIMIGLGLESYETKIKSFSGVSDIKLKTNMYDIFWLAPIPIINFTIGAGLGTAEFECNIDAGGTCSDAFDKAPVTQLWAQLGITLLPLLDVHMSYHKVSGELEGKDSNPNFDVGGEVIAVGVSLIF